MDTRSEQWSGYFGADRRSAAPCFWSARGKSDLMRRMFALGCFFGSSRSRLHRCDDALALVATVVDLSPLSSSPLLVPLPLLPAFCGFRGTKRPRAPLFPERGEQTRPTGPWVSTAEQQRFSLSNREYLGYVNYYCSGFDVWPQPSHADLLLKPLVC